MLKVIKAVVLLIVLCLGIALALRNAQAVRVDYLLGQGQLSLILVILATLVAGFLLGAVLGIARIASLRTQLRKSNRRIEKLEAENKALHNPALKDA